MAISTQLWCSCGVGLRPTKAGKARLWSLAIFLCSQNRQARGSPYRNASVPHPVRQTSSLPSRAPETSGGANFSGFAPGLAVYDKAEKVAWSTCIAFHRLHLRRISRRRRILAVFHFQTHNAGPCPMLSNAVDRGILGHDHGENAGTAREAAPAPESSCEINSSAIRVN